MVMMTAIEASTSIAITVFPSSPLVYVYQPKTLVTKKGYNMIFTTDTSANRMLND
jgi:hypothetical protein